MVIGGLATLGGLRGVDILRGRRVGWWVMRRKAIWSIRLRSGLRLRLRSDVTTRASKERSLGARFFGRVEGSLGLWLSVERCSFYECIGDHALIDTLWKIEGSNLSFTSWAATLAAQDLRGGSTQRAGRSVHRYVR